MGHSVIANFLRKKSAVSVPSGRASSSELEDSDSLDLSHMSSLSPSDSYIHITQIYSHQCTADINIQSKHQKFKI